MYAQRIKQVGPGRATKRDLQLKNFGRAGAEGQELHET
jgi:hypothetical protein